MHFPFTIPHIFHDLLPHVLFETGGSETAVPFCAYTVRIMKLWTKEGVFIVPIGGR